MTLRPKMPFPILSEAVGSKYLVTDSTGQMTESDGPAAAPTELNDLTDVTITGPTDGDLLMYSGGQVINARPAVDVDAAADGDVLYVVVSGGDASGVWLPRPGDYMNRQYRLELDAATGYPTWAVRQLSAQFPFDTNDTAGARRLVQLPHGWRVVGWLLRARNASGAASAVSASFLVEKAEWGASATDLVGTGTAPSLSSASDARDTDGVLDWTGDVTGDADSELLVELETVTWGAASQIVLTLKLEEL